MSMYPQEKVRKRTISNLKIENKKGVMMAFNILIVDDSSITRMVLKRTIGMMDIPVGEIMEAENGLKALDILCQHSDDIDIILADLNMPEMNGMEMAASILANPKTAHIPIVIVSTHSEDMRVKELQSQGVKDYIHKPFTPESIRNVLQKILEIPTT